MERPNQARKDLRNVKRDILTVARGNEVIHTATIHENSSYLSSYYCR